MIARLVLRRLVQGVVVFVAATFLLYCMVWLLPGDEIRALFGFARPDAETLAALRGAYHLDDPFLVQYGRYMWNFLHGDLGPYYSSRFTGELVRQNAVNTIVGSSLPITLRILAVSVLFQLTVAIPAGIASGRRPDKRAVVVVCAVAVAVPAFVAGTIVRLGAIQVLGGTFLESSGWAEALLPGIVAGVVPGALIVRVLRLRTADMTHEPWVGMLRASGVREPRIAWWFGGRQALVTGLTLVAAEVGPTLGALLVVERVFDIGGLGNVLLAAARAQQGPLITGSVTTFIAITVLATLLADIAVVVLEPRSRGAD